MVAAAESGLATHPGWAIAGNGIGGTVFVAVSQLGHAQPEALTAPEK